MKRYHGLLFPEPPSLFPSKITYGRLQEHPHDRHNKALIDDFCIIEDNVGDGTLPSCVGIKSTLSFNQMIARGLCT